MCIKKILAVLLIPSLMICGCATTRIAMMPTVTKLKEGNGVDRIFSDGKPIAISTIGKTSVVAQLEKKEEFLVLDICYKNFSSDRIDMDPTVITVEAIDKTGRIEKLRVYSAKEIGDHIRNKQVVKAAASTVGSILSLGLVTLSAVGIPGGSYVGSSVSSAYTALAVGGVAQQAINTGSGIQQQMTQAAYATEYGLLKTTTLFPNQYAEGGVRIKCKAAEKYIISVPFGDTIHVIEFVPTKVK
ncbi:MAG: hypothetical protein Q8O01_05620 [Candidatus Omnitrophota bacterium]|nr:hypothetical protein [Candidatus Omnitrophota bacterium]